MKYFSFIFGAALLTTAVSCTAQSKGTARLYAYRQSVISGVAPRITIDESGKQVNPQMKPKFNYYLYLSSSSELQPVAVYLNGVLLGAQAKSVSTPVENKNYTAPAQAKTTVLVPKSNQKVWQILPGAALGNDTFGQTVKDAAQKNEVVVVYKQKNKTRYSVQSKFTAMAPEALQ
jgi:hypothetical protein